METDRKARISTVTGTYFRSGKCADCGTSVERTKSFTAATQDDVSEQAAAWGKTTLRHKRCESAGSEALRRARSAVAEARDTRMEAADLAMVALHDDTVGSDAVTEAMEVWRRADADLQAARGRAALARAAAGVSRVVAVASGSAS